MEARLEMSVKPSRTGLVRRRTRKYRLSSQGEPLQVWFCPWEVDEFRTRQAGSMLSFEFRHARGLVSENFPKWEGRSCDRGG